MRRDRSTSKILLVLFCSAVLLRSQRLTWYERFILLPKARPVSAIVVDSAGKPIAGAHIDHSDVAEQERLFTDEKGRVQVRTRAPAFVVRKLGYDGRLIRTDDAGPLRVVLQRASSSLPACKGTCVGLKSPYSRLCFPSIPGIEVSDQAAIGNSVSREFMVPTRDGPREILLGSGPAWSLGVPFTSDIWESAQYSERAYTFDDSQIIDARGKTSAGKLWRYLGRFGESASYYEVDERDAALADRFLDGVCIAGSQP